MNPRFVESSPGSTSVECGDDDFDCFDDDKDLCDCHGKPWDHCPNSFDCGMLADGTCMLAGTEWCDWECPFS